MAKSDLERRRLPAKSKFGGDVFGGLTKNKAYQEFLSHYLDPTSKGFYRPSVSAKLIGRSNCFGSNALRRPDVQAYIKEVEGSRQEESKDVMRYLRTFDQRAAEELVSQMFLGKDLEMIDPQCKEALGKHMRKIDDKVTAMRAREINKHNQNVTSMARERRAALELLLAYQFGRPQQSMHVTKEEKVSLLDMSALSDEALREIQDGIQQYRDDKEIPVIEAELLEEGE